jgi:hypothetical protein
MNETLNKFLVVMANQEVARTIALSPPASPPPVTTPLKAPHPSRVNLGAPSNFDGDRAQGHADNLYTTQTPECTKDKYNAKIKVKGSLLRSHQQPT